MTMESSGGGTITVVEPGSPADPFSRAGAGQSATPDGSTPASQPAQTAPTNPDVKPPAQAPAQAPNTADIDRIVQERLSAAQSNWDKRNNALQAEIKAAREAAAAAEARVQAQQREFQLQGLRPDQQAQLREQWAIEDERAKLQAERAQVIDYHKTVEGLRLLTQYAPFGVTEEQLLGIQDLDEMEKFCLKAKADFFENGGAKGQTQGKRQPAGASAPIDAGGNPPAPEQGKLLTTAGVESIGANIKQMFADNGPNKPW